MIDINERSFGGREKDEGGKKSREVESAVEMSRFPVSRLPERIHGNNLIIAVQGPAKMKILI